MKRCPLQLPVLAILCPQWGVECFLMENRDRIAVLGCLEFCEVLKNTLHGGGFSLLSELSFATRFIFFKGSIGDMWRYIEEFGAYMIYGYGYARAGMSGGGTFDAKGNFVGMISGGTAESETASVPLICIEEAYAEIYP